MQLARDAICSVSTCVLPITSAVNQLHRLDGNMIRRPYNFIMCAYIDTQLVVFSTGQLMICSKSNKNKKYLLNIITTIIRENLFSFWMLNRCSSILCAWCVLRSQITLFVASGSTKSDLRREKSRGTFENFRFWTSNGARNRPDCSSAVK